MIFCPLYSGSSGNCTFVSAGDTAVLIDAGLTGKAIENALKSIGAAIESISAIVVTHEHSDHIKGIGV
ncbi:MAG: MBL fold metallo-hydrolase, partial [Clostridia bacterium]|nr:MBL fold metallo-hydrolase [Clostridia bacterium]